MLKNKPMISTYFLAIVAFFIVTIYPLSAADHHTKETTQICTQHKVDKSICFVCDPKLRQKGRMWCKEHDRYEDRCWLCHPELQDKKRMFCKEHNLYEDECLFCHPEIKKDKVCNKHKLNSSECFVCDPKLRQKGRMWCKEHDRYEDRCWLCHPELKEDKRPFCDEHNLYEDECFFCNSKLKKVDRSIDKKSASIIRCNEHRVSEHECGICQPQFASELKSGESMKIRMSSLLSAQKAGISTAKPIKTKSAPTVNSFCELEYDKNSYAHISPLSKGIVKRVYVDVGSNVKAGDVLLEIFSDEIAMAKASYLEAIVNYQLKEKSYKREERLVKEKISANREYQNAEAIFKVAQLNKNTTHQRLLNFGLSEKEVESISKSLDSSSLLSIRAPYDGVILNRNAVKGEFVQLGKPLLTMADISKMWLEMSIPMDRSAHVKIGNDVKALLDNFNGEMVEGKITWVSPSVDEHSRMIKARAIVQNPDNKLKSNMFGKATIFVGSKENALRVPKNSVYSIDDKQFLFVKVEEDLYDLRRIKVGNRAKSSVDILNGIDGDDDIVVAGTFTMVSEYLKSRLGAGCVDD
jgi:cobalt-zinc-cadmium efflux system membrane fusion protein